MDLLDAVELFSTETFLDALDPEVSIKGHLYPYAEVTNSGPSSQRRLLETPASQIMPPGFALIGPNGQTLIVAAENKDNWDGELIRHKYSTLPSQGVGETGPIVDILEATLEDTEIHFYPYRTLREIDENETSEYLNGYEIFVPPVKKLVSGNIFIGNGTYYRLQTDSWIDGVGYSVVQAVELVAPLGTLEVTINGGLNPVTDTYDNKVQENVLCFIEDMTQAYLHLTPASLDVEPGDRAVSLTKETVALEIGATIDGMKVLAIRDRGTWVTAHCRKEGANG